MSAQYKAFGCLAFSGETGESVVFAVHGRDHVISYEVPRHIDKVTAQKSTYPWLYTVRNKHVL